MPQVVEQYSLIASAFIVLGFVVSGIRIATTKLFERGSA